MLVCLIEKEDIKREITMENKTISKQFKYNPSDFPDGIKEDMQLVYDILNNKKTDISISHAVQSLYFEIKTSIKFGEIDAIEGKNMQQYFLELVDW